MEKLKIFIPNKIGIHSPEENKKVTGEQIVPKTTYWLRRVRMGDVQLVDEKQKQANQKTN